MGGENLIGYLIPLAIGLAAWRITESILRKKSYVLLASCVIACFIGFYLGMALVAGPYSPPARTYAAALIGAAIASAATAWVFAMMNKSPPAS